MTYINSTPLAASDLEVLNIVEHVFVPQIFRFSQSSPRLLLLVSPVPTPNKSQLFRVLCRVCHSLHATVTLASRDLRIPTLYPSPAAGPSRPGSCSSSWREILSATLLSLLKSDLSLYIRRKSAAFMSAGPPAISKHVTSAIKSSHWRRLDVRRVSGSTPWGAVPWSLPAVTATKSRMPPIIALRRSAGFRDVPSWRR